MIGIISDTHCHNWSMFSMTNEDGINSRLQIILDQIAIAGNALKDRGGKYLFHAGDLFHVRGSLAPSVLNPTLKVFQDLISEGIVPVIVCGNHDAEFRDVNSLGSAIYAFREIGCKVIEYPEVIEADGHRILCLPWIANKQDFLSAVNLYGRESDILICHMALDGVFSHIPASQSVDYKDIFKQSKSLKAIFAGHLHKHQDLSLDPLVVSVGSICQHTWGDIGTKAGYILYGDKYEFVESNAPQFVELSEATRHKVEGNYIRATIDECTAKELTKYRETLYKHGARGVTIICKPKQILRTDRFEIKTSDSLETIVDRYIKKTVQEPLRAEVAKKAQELLAGEFEV